MPLGICGLSAHCCQQKPRSLDSETPKDKQRSHNARISCHEPAIQQRKDLLAYEPDLLVRDPDLLARGQKWPITL